MIGRELWYPYLGLVGKRGLGLGGLGDGGPGLGGGTCGEG